MNRIMEDEQKRPNFFKFSELYEYKWKIIHAYNNDRLDNCTYFLYIFDETSYEIYKINLYTFFKMKFLLQNWWCLCFHLFATNSRREKDEA